MCCFLFGAEVWIFENMGGRKLKLGRALKNAERNKQKSLNLVVSIPRKLLHIQVCPVLKLSLCSEVKTIHWSVPWSTCDCVTAPICLCKWSCQFSSVTYIPHANAFSVTSMGYCLTCTFDYSFHILSARGAMSTYMVSVVLLGISVNYSSYQSPAHTLLASHRDVTKRWILTAAILTLWSTWVWLRARLLIESLFVLIVTAWANGLTIISYLQYWNSDKPSRAWYKRPCSVTLTD